ncbi:MAG: hypothetical protein OXL97_08425 [Chloroflexota bacterium]|nr:hypothetical protein [Chloroflexota bacterium]MDE2883819.1 hypothetical protein [Chloroflexota bacterium]
MTAAALSPSILNLREQVRRLAQDDASRFHRIYDVTESEGRLRVPPTMAPWVERTFGSVAAVESQRIVRASNVVTGEAAIFNELRARRPIRSSAAPDIEDELANDPWARPEENTPEDLFGRLRNDAALTAANVAKYDAHHSLVIFSEADPLRFDRASVRACVELANRWFAAAHEADPDAAYPFFLWNCLWRAGGSIVHGHAQVQLARGRHYARIEALRRSAAAYRDEHGADYFDDLAAVHTALGLGWTRGSVRMLASLTPTKEKETLILAPAFNEEAADALYDTLATFRAALGVQSFNAGGLLPPLRETPEDWQSFPCVLRVVDRGPLGVRSSDIGSMELFAEPVIASDPFAVAKALKEQ